MASKKKCAGASPSPVFEKPKNQNVHNKNGVIIYDNKSIPVTLLDSEKRGNAVIGDLKAMIPDTTIDDCINCNMVIFLDGYFSSPSCSFPSCNYDACACNLEQNSDFTGAATTVEQKCCR